MIGSANIFLMKILSLLVGAALAIALFSGCSAIREVNAGRYNENTKAGESWLSDQFDPAGVNVAGGWKSSDWGNAVLTQDGRTIGGRLGDYDVKGVASGSRAYLLLSEGGWNYYSAVLERPLPNVLTGNFSRSIPFVKNFSRPIRLEQIAP